MNEELDKKLSAFEERIAKKQEYEAAHPQPIVVEKPKEIQAFEDAVKEVQEALLISKRVFYNTIRALPVGTEESKLFRAYLAKAEKALDIMAQFKEYGDDERFPG